MKIKDLNTLIRMLQEMRSTAEAATGGHWRRDHGVVTSDAKVTGGKTATICFAEVGAGECMGPGYASWLKHEPTDWAKEMANSRHIVATQPGRVVQVTDLLEQLFTEGGPGESINALKERLAAAQKTVAFFASVIKSGEGWSAACQEARDEAMGGPGKVGQ